MDLYHSLRPLFNMSTILPEEIIYHIMLFCTPATLWVLRKTCKRFSALAIRAFMKQTQIIGRQIAIHPSVLEDQFWVKQQVLLRCHRSDPERQTFEFVIDSTGSSSKSCAGEFLCFQRGNLAARTVREHIVTLACTCWPDALNKTAEEMERRGYAVSEIERVHRPRYRGPLSRRRTFVAIPATEGTYEHVTEEMRLCYQVKLHSANDPEVRALLDRPAASTSIVMFVYFTSIHVSMNWLLSGFAVGHTEVPLRPIRLH
jgi:hypothetical protein